MFKNLLKQANPYKSLQFFAEPSDLGGSPSTTNGTTTTEPSTQAPITGDGAGQSQQQTVDYATYQASVKGMNEAQRDRAAWVNIAKEYGFNTPEDAKQAFVSAQEYQNLRSNPLPAIIETLKQNPMQAAQIFGQIFNNQQPQTSPYDNVTTYDELGNIVVKQSTESALNQINQQYGPKIAALENFIAQQYENGVKNQLNGQIPETEREAIWNRVREIGIPMQTIEAQPWIIDGIRVQLAGGLGKYAETLKSTAGQTAVNQYRDQVKSNANTATVTPVGGVPVIQGQEPILDPEARRQAVLNRVNAQIAAQT